MYVTNIQRFSLDDGPGIRTTVFMAGCNMRCQWCHNPETFSNVMLAYSPDKCIGCRRCEKACRQGVHHFEDRSHYLRWERCIACLKCVEVCERKALFLNSKEMSIDEIIKEVRHDERFYKKIPGGGVTFSGGEPVLQTEEVSDALKECKQRGIHTAIETAANCPFPLIESLLSNLDLAIVDCKAYTESVHIKCTGCSNKQILSNIKKLSDLQVRLWIRIPVIWNVNITLDELERIAYFLKDIRVEKVELLPYHKMGIAKYKIYGKKYSLHEAKPPSKEQLEECYRVLRRYQIPV